MDKWQYDELIDPTLEQLNDAGDRGWEVYFVDGTTYKLKRRVKQ